MKRIGTITTIDEAEARIAALRPIESQLDFTRTLSLKSYEDSIHTTRDCLTRFKALVAQLEAARRELNAAEAQLEEFNRRALQAVYLQFGGESEQYAAAGGTRPRGRKRAARQPDEQDTPPAGSAEAPSA